MKIETYAKNTWCPGCGNFGIISAFKKAIENEDLEKLTIVTGIGCHGKMFDYLNLSGFYALHGRPIATAVGIKFGNPELKVVVFAGDGDTYNEGISHLIHAANSNIDIKVFVHNNQVFALTVGQPTSTSEKGFIGKLKPLGKVGYPLNPIFLALASGATFVARAFAYDISHLTFIMEEALNHKGFAFVDILQPCISFHDPSQFIRKHSYKLEEENHDFTNFKAAIEKALEWNYNYNPNSKIPLGIFYKVEKETIQDLIPHSKQAWHKIQRNVKLEEIIKEFY